MKIIKKERRGIKIEHNRRLFWIIIILLIILIALILLINLIKSAGDNAGFECETDGDCTPAGCCHPESCASKEEAPDCKKVICTAVCSGPLDCGAGECGCVRGKCGIK